MFKFVINFLVLIFLNSPVKLDDSNEKILIYEDNSSLIYDETTDSGETFRYLSSVNDTDAWQGVISLESNWIHMECLQMIMSALFFVPEPRNVLIVGLGVGILAQTLDDTLDKTAFIDVVEIDPGMLELAKKYFFFQPSERVKIFVADGFDYIMSLRDTQLYDIIVLDAFAQGFCAPDSFFRKEFILKTKKQLTSNGILAVNTLPACSRHHQEMFIYQSVFKQYFTSELIDTNRIFLGINTQNSKVSQIHSEAESWRNDFLQFNVDVDWLLNVFRFDNKRPDGTCLNNLMRNICYHFDDDFAIA